MVNNNDNVHANKLSQNVQRADRVVSRAAACVAEDCTPKTGAEELFGDATWVETCH